MVSEKGQYPVAVAQANLIRWEKYCKYVGGGLGGLVLFGDLAKDAFAAADYTVRALFITSVIIAGAALARAYTGFSDADYELAEYLHSKTRGQGDDTPVSVKELERKSFSFYWGGLIFVVCAAGLLIMASWWPPLKP